MQTIYALNVQGVSAQLKSLQSQTLRRIREVQSSGHDSFASEINRSGHGRKRRLKPLQRFHHKINNAYKTLNHQISRRFIDFAIQQGVGTIQLTHLSVTTDSTTALLLGDHWHYYELQEFIKSKAIEVGIAVALADPQHISNRCHKCGNINESFTRKYLEKTNRQVLVTASIFCADHNCGVTAVNPDLNAAKSFATKHIAQKIKRQRKKQGIVVHDTQTEEKAIQNQVALN